MKLKTVFLDFEFCRTVEPVVNLVSCATYSPDAKWDDKFGTNKLKWWLHNDPKEKRRLAEYLRQFNLIIGYACVAEARSYLALGLDPLKFQWIDLFLEYRMLTNHNDDLQWGWQLVDGKKRFVKKT